MRFKQHLSISSIFLAFNRLSKDFILYLCVVCDKYTNSCLTTK